MHAYLVCIYHVLYTLWTCTVFDVMLEMIIYIYVLLQVLFILLSQFLYFLLSFIDKQCILNQLEKRLFLFFILWQ